MNSSRSADQNQLRIIAAMAAIARLHEDRAQLLEVVEQAHAPAVVAFAFAFGRRLVHHRRPSRSACRSRSRATNSSTRWKLWYTEAKRT